MSAKLAVATSGFALAACVVSSARAGSTASDTAPRIADVWSRATVDGGMTGIYASIVAPPGTDDRLVAVRVPWAASAELQEADTVPVLYNGGCAVYLAYRYCGRYFLPQALVMRAVDGIELPAGRTKTLTPVGDHVLLIGVRRGLDVGQRFRATFVFERAGDVVATVKVR